MVKENRDLVPIEDVWMEDSGVLPRMNGMGNEEFSHLLASSNTKVGEMYRLFELAGRSIPVKSFKNNMYKIAIEDGDEDLEVEEDMLGDEEEDEEILLGDEKKKNVSSVKKELLDDDDSDNLDDEVDI